MLFERQGSTRGQKAKRRAAFILANIHKQRNTRRQYGKPLPPRLRAPFQLLVKAMAVECFFPWPVESTTTYKRTQVSRQVHRMLGSDKLMLYGRVHRYRIRMEGQAVARYIYRMIEPVYRLWLRDHKAEILSLAAEKLRTTN